MALRASDSGCFGQVASDEGWALREASGTLVASLSSVQQCYTTPSRDVLYRMGNHRNEQYESNKLVYVQHHAEQPLPSSSAANLGAKRVHLRFDAV